DVGGVGKLRVGHDRGRVRIEQDHPVALGTEDLGGLGAGIVELAGLSDHDRARADEKDGADVGAGRHQASPPFVSDGSGVSSPIMSTNSSMRWTASCGPGAASG